MKLARFILKIIAASLAFAAGVCCIIAYWDKIVACIGCVSSRLEAQKYRSAEYADYADLDE